MTFWIPFEKVSHSTSPMPLSTSALHFPRDWACSDVPAAQMAALILLLLQPSVLLAACAPLASLPVSLLPVRQPIAKMRTHPGVSCPAAIVGAMQGRLPCVSHPAGQLGKCPLSSAEARCGIVRSLARLNCASLPRRARMKSRSSALLLCALAMLAASAAAGPAPDAAESAADGYPAGERPRAALLPLHFDFVVLRSGMESSI